MQLDPNKIRNGKHDGEIVYTCHLNIPDLHKKPLRNIPPTKAKIIPEHDSVNKGKRVYYSTSLFQLYNKDKLTSKTTKLFDNTGYRAFTGNPLFMFDSLEECEAQWREGVSIHIERLKEHRLSIVKSIDNKINEFEELLV